MTKQRFGLCLFLASVSGCTGGPGEEPSGPMARLGAPPTIDGVFEVGEWGDAEIVRAVTGEQFRIKHDGNNLYFAINGTGGDLRLRTSTGLRILHWSAQLGSAEYTESDPPTLSLSRPFAYELLGLQDESAAVIQGTVADYLAENGWVANLAPMGNLGQSELAVSFELLEVDTGSGRFAELPGVRISSGLLVSRHDPRTKEILALTQVERDQQYPGVFWPTESEGIDSIGMGLSVKTIRPDQADFGKIWIDFGG